MNTKSELRRQGLRPNKLHIVCMCIVPTSLFVQICLEFCRKTVRVLCTAMSQNSHNQLWRLAGMGHCRYKLAKLRLGRTRLVQVYYRHLPPLWLFAAVTILTSRPGGLRGMARNASLIRLLTNKRTVRSFYFMICMQSLFQKRQLLSSWLHTHLDPHKNRKQTWLSGQALERRAWNPSSHP